MIKNRYEIIKIETLCIIEFVYKKNVRKLIVFLKNDYFFTKSKKMNSNSDFVTKSMQKDKMITKKSINKNHFLAKAETVNNKLENTFCKIIHSKRNI